MQNILDFFIFFFFILFFYFFFNYGNFLFLFLFSEIIWIVMYCICLIAGLNLDNFFFISSSFFILGFTSIEFVICFLIILNFKENNLSENIFNNKNQQAFLKNFDFSN